MPPGFQRNIEPHGERVYIALEPQSAALLDPTQPGWLGLIARGEGRGIETAAQGADPRARLAALDVRGGRVEAEISVSASEEPAAMPQAAALMKFSTATGFAFDTSEARLGR